MKFDTPKVDRSQDYIYEEMVTKMRSRMGTFRAEIAPPVAAPGASAPATAPRAVAAPAAALPPGFAASGKKPGKQQVPLKPFHAKMSMTAEWRVKPGEPEAEAQVLEIEKLQEAIRSADLAGLKETQEMTPEEAELFEEVQSSTVHLGYGRRERKRGDPEFSFSANVPVADYEKALAEAFREAKNKAVQLAKAAEIELGPLQSLQSGVRVTREDDDDTIGPRHPSYSSYPVEFSSTDFFVTGSHPGILTCSVTVTASYSIK